MKRTQAFFSLLLLIALLYYSFYGLMPRKGTPSTIPETEFSTERALIPLKEITKKPHYVGSEAHAEVREYLIGQLRALGLDPQTQEGFVLTPKRGRLVKPVNIMARISGSKGSGPALLIFSHYDSASVPSHGASDAGSGVVTILESLRAYMATGAKPVNDIIVLFTDAEEIGLDGAKLFIREHPWAKDVGLALNFEARGSGGPSNMIIESNGGNKNLVKGFVEARPKYPVASSLMYSIYKMLPNDTDSTILREEGDIDGFFFAFIDDHFDYHTANDNFENLDRNSLQHQGSYLMPLLTYFADADLSNIKSDEDYVYVNFPLVNMISYPFSWILPMLLLAVVLFVLLLFYGIKKGRLQGNQIGKGFIPLLLSLVVCGILGFFGWKLIEFIYPHYSEIQHGFKYNGHTYVAFFVALSLAVLFMFYRRLGKDISPANLLVAPLLLWIIINTAVFVYLKGGAFFIIPVFFGLLSLWLLIRQEKPHLLLMTLLAAPALFIFAPLIQFFPVGLGSDNVHLSCVFTVLLFGLCIPVIGFYKLKRLFSIIFFVLAFGFFVSAHFSNDFSEDQHKPNSLVYYQLTDTQKAYWVTYDDILDEWTRGYLGDSLEEASKYVESAAGSKYNTGYSYAAEAPMLDIPQFDVRLDKDTLIDAERQVTFTIIPQRKVHMLRLYADLSINFNALNYNGQDVPKDSTGRVYSDRINNGLLVYNVSDNDSLEVSYAVPDGLPVKFKVLEYSYDLMTNPKFTINRRPAYTTPKPFINTDAVVLTKTIDMEALSKTMNDSLTVPANE